MKQVFGFKTRSSLTNTVPQITVDVTRDTKLTIYIFRTLVNASLVICQSSIVFSINNELKIAVTGYVDLVYWNDECILDLTGDDCCKIEVMVWIAEQDLVWIMLEMKKKQILKFVLKMGRIQIKSEFLTHWHITTDLMYYSDFIMCWHKRIKV